MRYDKTLYIPREKCVYEHIPPSRLREGETILMHMRYEDQKLICAENAERVDFITPECSRIYTTDQEIFLYEKDNKALYELNGKARYPGLAEEPMLVAVNHTKEEIRGIYCVEPRALRYLQSGKFVKNQTITASCAAYYHGRLFTAYQNTLYYSRALADEGMTVTVNDPDGAGYIDLDEAGGEIIALVPFRERLYLFREHGIVKVSAEGEAANFSADEAPYTGGTVIKGSVAKCGDRIAYFTERGLFSFDGSVDRAERCMLGEIDFTKEISASEYNGNYLALVTLTDGNKALYVYDFQLKYGRYIFMYGVVSVSWPYAIMSDKVMKFTPQRGLPQGTGLCWLSYTVHSAPRALKWVRVSGKGVFQIIVSTGESYYRINGGEKAYIRGEKFSTETVIRIETGHTDFCIDSIDLCWRELYGH